MEIQTWVKENWFIVFALILIAISYYHRLTRPSRAERARARRNNN